MPDTRSKRALQTAICSSAVAVAGWMLALVSAP
jgi:hypothetical protein